MWFFCAKGPISSRETGASRKRPAARESPGRVSSFSTPRPGAVPYKKRSAALSCVWGFIAG